MKKFYLITLLFLSLMGKSQFVSPGTGSTYTLSSISQAAPSVLSKDGNVYTMLQNITISANDTLLMDEDATLKITGGLQITVAGTYNTTAQNLLITAVTPDSIFKGILFDDTSNVVMKNTTLEYGGGIRVSTTNFLMDNCIVRYFKSGLVTGSAVSFSTGKPIVQNSQFIENDLPALSSASNATVSARFIGNYIYKNSKTSNKRPQLNMGPGGIDSIKIINNTIIGDRNNTTNGGISVSALVGGINRFRVEGNTIKDNSFGITSYGGASSGIIINNVIEYNNTITDPNLGGSGISLSNTGIVKISGNQIRHNLWGITLIGVAKADIGGGSLGSTGNNIFKNNGNGGKIYALFNNTANSVSAINNCWREGELSSDAMVEDVISHQPDINTLGAVTFKPYLCASTLSTNDVHKTGYSIYPVPNNGQFTIESVEAGNVMITDISGQLIYSGIIKKGINTMKINVKPGVYIVSGQSGGKTFSSKMIVH